ncbi:MAG: hypothetical protein LAO51_03265 [Acidobacteriia bacterium]|nr:hypothetical protein [Terriglobia bacterium]
MRTIKTLTSIGFLGLVALAVVGATAAKVPGHQPTHYGFDWSITQEPGSEKAFRCTLEVRDLDTGMIITQPMLLSRWGERAEVTAKGEGFDLTASAVVSADGHKAEFEAKLLSQGRPVAKNQASVGL